MGNILFVIPGHGAGDPGACANGFNEAERVRALASRIKAFGGASVTIGDPNRNWYADNGIGRGQIPKGNLVLELHLDSAAASARGGHVIIKSGFSADKYDTSLAVAVSRRFPGRSKTIVGRDDLANPNRAAAMGYNYRLLECCFISNAGDIAKFNAEMDAFAKDILAAFDIPVTGSTPAPQPSQPQQPSNPPATSASYLVKVTADVLNIRKGPGTNYAVTGSIKDKGTYTIVAESSGPGANKWGKLKSGAGWISLDWTSKGGSAPAAPAPAPKTMQVGSTVRVTNPVDWNGTRLGVSGNYTVMEIKGDRVVIGRGGVVTAAMHRNNLALV